MTRHSPVHSKLLTAAARTALSPLGLIQKGRSRIWLDDHQWWLCVVEFQPSSWARGSYLNVGCMWLWCVQDYISFDLGYRVEPFVEFRDEEQFETLAGNLINGAVQEVKRYRLMFPNVASVCNYYLSQEVEDGWPTYHAAVACGLANKPHAARAHFEKFMKVRASTGWLANAQEDANHLASLVDTGEFRDVIANRVRQTRKIQKLAVGTDINFGGSS